MKRITEKCLAWTREYFSNNDCNAIVGVSGGKDSTVVAALCARALGNSRVIGVMMPNNGQNDIADSERVCNILGISNMKIDIAGIYGSFANTLWNMGLVLSRQTKVNLAPRIRMTMLYAIAQSMNGRVANTSNLDEALVGYATLWGDSVGDFAPLANLHVSQVVEIGLDLGLPEDLVLKTPSDGLTGMTDEEALGFSYKDVENAYEKRIAEVKDFTEREKNAILRMDGMCWKRRMVAGIPSFNYEED